MFKKETKQIVKALASMVTVVTIGAILGDKVIWPWVVGDE